VRENMSVFVHTQVNQTKQMLMQSAAEKNLAILYPEVIEINGRITKDGAN